MSLVNLITDHQRESLAGMVAQVTCVWCGKVVTDPRALPCGHNCCACVQQQLACALHLRPRLRSSVYHIDASTILH